MPIENNALEDIIVVGGGFAGLATAYELAKRGHAVTVLESESSVGGLARAFDTSGERLDRFYHHWFTSDLAVQDLISELGMAAEVSINETNTGIYYSNRIFRLSSPIDLLKFTPLPLVDRIRLGILALRARRVRDWRELERETAAAWLRRLGGDNVYRAVWEPLMKGKFGPYAEKISAVWFWNKLKLRGGSRGKSGAEKLVYLKGSFARLAEATAAKISEFGGEVLCGRPVDVITPSDDGRWTVSGSWGSVAASRVVVTTALPLAADMISHWAEPAYLASLRRIEYLANVCLILRLDRSLSSTYWLNVNDPTFPYVGVIEHTNFEKPESYGGDHVVYLSKYLPHTDELYGMSDEQVFSHSLPHIKRMFPDFENSWVRRYHVWRSRWSQPVVETNYSALIPAEDGPRRGFHLCSMAQVYPEDRGTNYAVREGRKLGRRLSSGQP